MLDLVLAENVRAQTGVKTSVFAPALKSFKQPSSLQTARADAKFRGALLHIPSYDANESVCSELAKSKGSLVFSLCDLVKTEGFRRGIIISKMRLALDCCRRCGCGAIFCTLAKSESEARNAREITAFASVLGASSHEKKHSEKIISEAAGA